MKTHHIAIIGMGCNYPGAPNVAAMWDQVRDGRSAIREVGADRWDVDRYFDLHPRAVDKTYSKHMAALDDITSFAPEFYGITPKRARVMDPQQRVFLECARVALEDAGYATRSLPKETTGVYAGISTSDHRDMSITRVRVNQMLDGVFGQALNVTDEVRDQLISRVPAIHAYTMVGQLLNMNAANISQAFDLGGPTFTVDTACSSALVALQQAVLHLRLGITDAALVGGAFVSLDPAMFVCFSRIGALSRSGACNPFEERADGFVLGEGAGMVVLKRLEDARRDGDRVWAVIDGLAVNNDARAEGPMTPSKKGQLSVLRAAYRDANVSPNTVGLVEGHGTATAAGDSTEVAALTDLFNEAAGERREVALTSVKANVGHGLASSGMASLIKTVLALANKTIPAQAGFKAVRKDLDLNAAGLTVPRESKPWVSSDVRRAGVSSFGFGGTNAHVVLSEARDERPVAVVAAPKSYRVTFSAPNAELLFSYLTDVRAALKNLPANVTLADVAFTAALRRVDTVRVQVEVSTLDQLDAALTNAVVCYGDVKPADMTQFENCRVVNLPASPLATRALWLIAEADEEMAPVELVVAAQAREQETDRVAELMNEMVAAPAPVRVSQSSNNIGARFAARVSASAREGGKGVETAFTRQHLTELRQELDEVQVVELTGEVTVAAQPVVESVVVDTTAVEPVVLDAIARVSAYPTTHLKLSQSLSADLGFDSLMSADLMGELATAFPGLGDGRDLLSTELTIEGLIAAIATKVSSASARANESELRRDTVATTREMTISLVEQPWLADHTVKGMVLVPLAFVTDVVVDMVKSVVDVPMAVADLTIEQGVRLVDGKVEMRVELNEAMEVTVSSAATLAGPWTVCYRMNVKKVETPFAELLTLDSLEPTSVSVEEFYRDYAFHGPSLQAVADEPRLGARSVSGVVRSSMTAPASKQLSVLAFDGALQVAAFWTAARLGRMALPKAVAEIRVLQPMNGEPLYCAGVLESQNERGLTAHLDVLNGAGEPVLQLRGLQVQFLAPAVLKGETNGSRSELPNRSVPGSGGVAGAQAGAGGRGPAAPVLHAA